MSMRRSMIMGLRLVFIACALFIPAVYAEDSKEDSEKKPTKIAREIVPTPPPIDPESYTKEEPEGQSSVYRSSSQNNVDGEGDIQDEDTPIPEEPHYNCGNGIQEPGEGCDDGNFTIGDGCSPNCQVEPNQPTPQPGCGDGTVGPGEECEPPGTLTCSANCQIPTENIPRCQFLIESGQISNGCSSDSQCTGESDFCNPNICQCVNRSGITDST